MHRTGGLDDQAQTITIDQLDYSYPTNSNQLSKVTDTTNEPQGFKDDTATDPTDADDDYIYDANGNMTKDDNKGITKIVYNHLNLPTQITFGTTGIITYLYDVTGKKVKKVIDIAGEQTITDYLDGFQYKNNEMQFFATAEGYANISHTKYGNGIFEHDAETINNQYSYVYNYVDHLGNIRLSYGKDPSNGALRIIEENHYYPFGLKHTNYNSDKMIYVREEEILKIKLSPNNIRTGYNRKYNGKMWEEDLGLNIYDYGMMQYDPAIGRRNNIDQKIEQMRRWSTYSYCYDNPIRFTDPDGMKPNDWFVNFKTGGVIYVKGESKLTQSTFEKLGFGGNAKDYSRLGADNMFGSKVMDAYGGNILDKKIAVIDFSVSFMRKRGYEKAENVTVKESEYKSGGRFGEENFSQTVPYLKQIGDSNITYVKPSDMNTKEIIQEESYPGPYSSSKHVTYNTNKPFGQSNYDSAYFYSNRTDNADDATTGAKFLNNLAKIFKTFF